MATVIDSQQKTRLRRPRWIKEPFNREARAGYLFILPWVIGFLVFTLGAMVYSLVISFTNYDLSTDTATPWASATTNCCSRIRRS